MIFACCLNRIENLKNHYNRDFRIWQIRIDRTFAKIVAIITSNWRLFSSQTDNYFRFFLNDFFDRLNKSFVLQNFRCRNDNRWRCCVYRVCWNFDDNVIANFSWTRWIVEIILLIDSRRRFSYERFSRIELFQNKCFQKHFKCTFRRRLEIWLFRQLFYDSRSVWFSIEYIITYNFKRFVKNLLCKQISETKTKRCIQRFIIRFNIISCLYFVVYWNLFCVMRCSLHVTFIWFVFSRSLLYVAFLWFV